MVWLPDGEKTSKIPLFVLTECTNVTDGQTNKHRMLAQAALTHSIARQNGMVRYTCYMQPTKYELPTLLCSWVIICNGTQTASNRSYYLKTFIRLVVFWSRGQHQHHVTTSLMKLAVGERNVTTNLGIISRLCRKILFQNLPYSLDLVLSSVYLCPSSFILHDISILRYGTFHISLLRHFVILTSDHVYNTTYTFDDDLTMTT